jgi:hypothetical protein
LNVLQFPDGECMGQVSGHKRVLEKRGVFHACGPLMCEHNLEN